MAQSYNLGSLGLFLSVNSVSNTAVFSNAISVGSAVAIGNGSVNVSINSTAFSGTSNNTLYVGSVSAANVVSNAQLSSNLAGYAALSGAAFTGNVSIAGNLIVSGTTLTVNATTLDVRDLNITVAKGSGSAVGADGAGLTVDGANVGWYYNNASNTWQSNVGITPSANVSFNLGSSALNWSNVYSNNVFLAGTVNAASHTVGTSFIANTTQLTIATPLSANGGVGTAGYVLTSNGATGSPYWAVAAAGTNVASQYAWTNTQSFSNAITFSSGANLVFSSGARILDSTSSQGTAGQVLTSNGAGNVYWSTVTSGGGSVNTAAVVAFTNTATSTNTTSGAVTILGGLGVGDNIYTDARYGFANAGNISVAYSYYNEVLNSIDTVFG